MPELCQCVNPRRKKQIRKINQRKPTKLERQSRNKTEILSFPIENFAININKVTAEIKEKQNEISKLNQRMAMLKAELNHAKEKLCETGNEKFSQ